MPIEIRDRVSLWWERVGDGPSVVLIPGRGDSSDLFPRLFVDGLVDAGLSVIRMDPRDTGLSGDGGNGYSLATMADDIVAVLNAARVERSHTVAVSMGGMLTVDLVARHRERVMSSTFIAAMSPDPEAGMGPDFFTPLESADRLETILALMGSPDESDRSWLALELEHAGTRAPIRPDASERHMAASFAFGWPALDALENFTEPALVVHGTDDRLLPLQHARSLASRIRGSELRVIDGMGHLPTRSQWDLITQMTAGHLAG